VVFETMLSQRLGADGGAPGQPVKVARIERDARPFKLIHEPGHPDANRDGMLAMPDINIHEEMVDLIAASRAFEANLAVLKNSRSLATQTLAIGKRG
jgi:flagellar basal-body rod protein FlgC